MPDTSITDSDGIRYGPLPLPNQNIAGFFEKAADSLKSDPPADLAALNATVQDLLTEQMEHGLLDIDFMRIDEGRYLRGFTATCKCGHSERGDTVGGVTAKLYRRHPQASVGIR